MPRRSPSAPPGADPVDVQLGRALRRARKERGLSQQALANQLALSGQQIQKYESGANRISVSVLLRLARVLGRSPVSFLPPGTPGGSASSEPVRAMAALMERIPSLEHRRALLVLARGLSGKSPAS